MGIKTFMKKPVLTLCMAFMLPFSAASCQDTGEQREAGNQVSAGFNFSYILAPYSILVYTPFRYAIGYKRNLDNAYRLRNGLEFNWGYERGTPERRYFGDGLLLHTGVEKLFPNPVCTFMLGADIMGFTKREYSHRGYGYGIGLVSGWQIPLNRSVSISGNINISIADDEIRFYGERSQGVLINRLLFLSLDYHF
jgi:hypothetical protein